MKGKYAEPRFVADSSRVKLVSELSSNGKLAAKERILLEKSKIAEPANKIKDSPPYPRTNKT